MDDLHNALKYLKARDYTDCSSEHLRTTEYDHHRKRWFNIVQPLLAGDKDVNRFVTMQGKRRSGETR